MDHPFHVDGKGWTAVEDMGPGDQLISATIDGAGASMLVKSIEAEGYTAATYNLTVANAHTFFAGEERIWVHNTEGCGLTWTGNTPAKLRKHAQLQNLGNMRNKSILPRVKMVYICSVVIGTL